MNSAAINRATQRVKDPTALQIRLSICAEVNVEVVIVVPLNSKYTPPQVIGALRRGTNERNEGKSQASDLASDGQRLITTSLWRDDREEKAICNDQKSESTYEQQ